MSNDLSDVRTPDEIYKAVETIQWAAKNMPSVLDKAFRSKKGKAGTSMIKGDDRAEMARNIVKSVNAPDHEKIGARIADQVIKEMGDESHEKAAVEIVKAVS